MSRWYRAYAGMMRDDKLVRVAIRSKQTIERVCWVWGAILESAAEIDEDGRYDFDVEEAAYFLRANPDDIVAIVSSLEGSGRLDKGAVAKWGDRQFSSDRSAERQRLYRARQKANNLGNAPLGGRADDGEVAPSPVTVTSLSRHGDAPETELETETEVKTEAKASSKKRQPIPDDWQPRAFAIGSESRKVVDSWPPGEEPAQLEQFIAHHRSKRNTFLDPQDAWSTWVLNTRKWGIGRHERSSNPTGDAVSRVIGRIGAHH